mgnify:CR=1 FL=1
MIPDTIIVETTRRIFRDLADPQTVHNSSEESWCMPLWSALVDAGLTLAWCAEDKGGAGASLVDGFAIQKVVGEFATPIPLAETLLANWLLQQVKIKPSTGRTTVAPDVHVCVERAAWCGWNVDAHDRCVLMKQVIRNVNREARIERMKRAGLT